MGYYIPTKEDGDRLERNNNREKKKAISTLAGNKLNSALVEDFKHGRLEGVT